MGLIPRLEARARAEAEQQFAAAHAYEQQLADFNEEEYRRLENLKELFEFLDDIIPLDDDDEDEQPKRQAGRKR